MHLSPDENSYESMKLTSFSLMEQSGDDELNLFMTPAFFLYLSR